MISRIPIQFDSFHFFLLLLQNQLFFFGCFFIIALFLQLVLTNIVTYKKHPNKFVSYIRRINQPSSEKISTMAKHYNLAYEYSYLFSPNDCGFSFFSGLFFSGCQCKNDLNKPTG